MDRGERSLIFGVQKAWAAQEGKAAGPGFPLDDLAGACLAEGEPGAALDGKDGHQDGEPLKPCTLSRFGLTCGTPPRSSTSGSSVVTCEM
jgi:hypothetical protein